MMPPHALCIDWYTSTSVGAGCQDVSHVGNVSRGMKSTKAVTPRGRPRAFDIDQALDRALWTFWRHGYEGTSLSDLTKAMGINRPSLYAAFGDKQALFHQALDRYLDGPAAYVGEALKAPTAREVVERLLRGAVHLLTDPRHPRGCLLVQGALACGAAASPIRKALMSGRAAGEAALRQRLERAKSTGDLSADSDPADLARYVVTIVHGLAVQAAGGSSRAELHRVIQTALRAWPE
jgi:AcrR family transcriptional regulator